MSSELYASDWTLDCQGKQDLEADIVSFSSRFYPQRYQSNGKFCTIASIYVDGIAVVGAQFEHETESGVKEITEEWARAQISFVISTVKAAVASKGDS